jgi:RNA polymerase sigma factor (sigma-70 family)
MVSLQHASRPSSPPLGLGSATDDRLTALAAAGHERAYTAIYARYHQRLYRYCLTLVRNEADAQDALQSTFAAAIAAFQKGPPSAPLRPWLFRIAHNEAISLLRRRRPAEAIEEVGDLAGGGADLADQLVRRGELQTLIADLRDLPDRQRGALVMRELSGLSHEEIGLALGVSAAIAKQSIFEARRSLMQFAAGRELACEAIRAQISHSDGDGRTMRSRRVRGHLRSCAGCTSFADQIRGRRATLKALAPPLPAAAAAEVLRGALGSGAGAVGSGGAVASGGAAGSGGAAAGVTGKLAIAGLTTKSLAGAALVITAGVGIGGLVTRALEHSAAATHHVGRAREAVPQVSASGGVVPPTASASGSRLRGAGGLGSQSGPASRGATNQRHGANGVAHRASGATGVGRAGGRSGRPAGAAPSGNPAAGQQPVAGAQGTGGHGQGVRAHGPPTISAGRTNRTSSHASGHGSSGKSTAVHRRRGAGSSTSGAHGHSGSGTGKGAGAGGGASHSTGGKGSGKTGGGGSGRSTGSSSSTGAGSGRGSTSSPGNSGANAHGTGKSSAPTSAGTSSTATSSSPSPGTGKK